MRRRPDGTFINTNLRIKPEVSGRDQYRAEGSQLMIGQVIKVHFLDDPSHTTKTASGAVEYDVLVVDSKGGGSTYENVRSVVGFAGGGMNDFDQTILEASEISLTNLSPIGGLGHSFQNTNGQMVLLAFINNALEKPIIIATIPHLSKGGAFRSVDGVHKKGEFRGISYEINQRGEFELKFNSPKTPIGTPLNPLAAGTAVKLDQLGGFKVSDNEGQYIEMNRTTKKVELRAGDKAGSSEVKHTLDGLSEKVTITTTSGITITVDGKTDKFTITTTGGAEVSVDGTMDKIEAKTSAGAKLVLDGTNSKATLTDNTLIEIGEGATEPIILGNAFTLFYNTHFHVGNLGAPTSPPLAPMGPTELSTKAKVIN